MTRKVLQLELGKSCSRIIRPVNLLFQVIRYVSWNEFVHHMLAKGEVEEVIVRPDVDIVTIILYDGAIIKGKRVRNTIHL